MTRTIVSQQTLKNWLLDASLFASALAVTASSIYFLFMPSGGYKGGRNPAYNAIILFTRTTWDSIHTWTGLAMIVIALVHLLIHWKWVTSMAKRSWREITSQGERMNPRARFNVWTNLTIGLSFLLAAISGVYFYIFGGSHGGANPDPLFLFTRTTWDLIHTWSGVTMILAAVTHFAIHWRWVVNVTGKLAHAVLPRPQQPILDAPSAR